MIFRTSLMLKRLYIFLIMLVIATGSAFSARNWEEVSNPPASIQKQDRFSLEQEDVDVAVFEGCIYITSNKPVQVKVFTILGQIISAETVPAGYHRLKLNSRGIYILRVGTQTRRITL